MCLRVRQAGFLNFCIALEISSFNGLNDATSLLRKTDRFVSPTLTRYQSGESFLELQFLFRFQDYCPPSSTMSVELNQILQRNVVTLSSSLLPPLTRPGLGVCSVGFLVSRFGCPLFCTLVRRLVILCAERSRFLSQNFDLIARWQGLSTPSVVQSRPLPGGDYLRKKLTCVPWREGCLRGTPSGYWFTCCWRTAWHVNLPFWDSFLKMASY